MGLPFLSSPPSQQQEPQTVIHQPTIGSPNPDPSRMQYHAEVERFEEDLNQFRALLGGKRFVGFDKEDKPIFELIRDSKNNPIRPFCNSEGQQAIMGFLEARLKPNTPLSNMDVDRVYILLKSDHLALRNMCYLKAFDWELQVESWKTIHLSIMNSVELADRRSIDNQERDWITKIFNVIETTNRSNEKKQDTGITSLFRGK